jgi:hypothetical protein
MDGGITAFQMDDDQFVPEDCNLFVTNTNSDISSPGALGALLFCLLADGQHVGGTLVEFTGLRNFENHQFQPPRTPVVNGEETVEFSIPGQAGDVWFITTDLFLFAHNEGYADSRNTMIVEIENHELVEASFPVESFELAPPLTVRIGIDIAPKAKKNNVEPGSPESLAVAILGSDDFDTNGVEVDSLRFGAGMAAPLAWKPRFRDVNGDGHADLIVRFAIGDTGIVCGDTQAELHGLADGDVPFVGSDYIRTTECP